MRLQFISAKIDMLCDYFCELLSQLNLQNRTMRFFVYEKNYKFCDMNMRTYTLHKTIFVTPNLVPFAVSVFFSAKI